jgi:DNA (cytosine-5)-methyltransferase 1
MLTFGSLCSGVEAASVAWNPLGWKASWFSEIDKFPSAVLNHHYPETENVGDMLKVPELILTKKIEAPDIICGGTPCQSFSVAGLQQSLNDSRGNLTLTFCEVANSADYVRRLQGRKPTIILWENVPGVLKTKDNAFGCFIKELSGAEEEMEQPTKGWSKSGIIVGPKRTVCWRVLDAQYFGLAQRRKRVFVVASARDDIDIGKILFDFESMQRNAPPNREASNINSTTSEGNVNREVNSDRIFGIIGATAHSGFGGFTVSATEHVSPTLTASHANVIATRNLYLWQRSGYTGAHVFKPDISPTLTVHGANQSMPIVNLRYLTPIECERVQGFPDNYTKIPYNGKALDECSDRLRYRALGNSWAVSVITWIGKRIKEEIKNAGELDAKSNSLG